eukprot:scpid90187/ scgid21238/ 
MSVLCWGGRVGQTALCSLIAYCFVKTNYMHTVVSVVLIAVSVVLMIRTCRRRVQPGGTTQKFPVTRLLEPCDFSDCLWLVFYIMKSHEVTWRHTPHSLYMYVYHVKIDRAAACNDSAWSMYNTLYLNVFTALV